MFIIEKGCTQTTASDDPQQFQKVSLNSHQLVWTGSHCFQLLNLHLYTICQNILNDLKLSNTFYDEL